MAYVLHPLDYTLLISLVEEHQVLYFGHNASEIPSKFSKKAWINVGQRLGYSHITCKVVWTDLYLKFITHLTMKRLKEESVFEHEEQMMFLLSKLEPHLHMYHMVFIEENDDRTSEPITTLLKGCLKSITTQEMLENHKNLPGLTINLMTLRKVLEKKTAPSNTGEIIDAVLRLLLHCINDELGDSSELHRFLEVFFVIIIQRLMQEYHMDRMERAFPGYCHYKSLPAMCILSNNFNKLKECYKKHFE